MLTFLYIQQCIRGKKCRPISSRSMAPRRRSDWTRLASPWASWLILTFLYGWLVCFLQEEKNVGIIIVQSSWSFPHTNTANPRRKQWDKSVASEPPPFATVGDMGCFDRRMIYKESIDFAPLYDRLVHTHVESRLFPRVQLQHQVEQWDKIVTFLYGNERLIMQVIKGESSSGNRKGNPQLFGVLLLCCCLCGGEVMLAVSFHRR